MDQSAPDRLKLRDLSLPTRLVIAVFMVSVGLGYFSALVQLHFQHAHSGDLLPGLEEASDTYHGKPRLSRLERLLTADESKPFNGSGTMRPAFTFESSGWNESILLRTKAAIAKLPDRPKEIDPETSAWIEEEVIQKLRAERDGERLVLLDWLRHGADPEAYEKDRYPLPANLAGHPMTSAGLVKGADEEPIEPRVVKIKTLIEVRCVRCHKPGMGAAGEVPLDNYENISVHCQPESASGMSLTKLAQTTHVHLLGFSMLFGLTGLVFTWTSYPVWVRTLFGPFALVAQIVDISCWWLGRCHTFFAQAIVVTGGLVALGLLIQILGSLFNLFGKTGQRVVAVLLVAAAAGMAGLNFGLIRPYLARERQAPEIRGSNRFEPQRHRGTEKTRD